MGLANHAKKSSVISSVLLRLLALHASGSLCLLNNFPPRLWLWIANQPVMCYKDSVLQGLDCTVSPAALGRSGKAPTALQAGCHGCADHMHAGASPMHT